MTADAKIQVLRLSHVHYQHPDLCHAAKFLGDFGLVRKEESDGCIYFSGYGVDPYCYIAEQSPTRERKFLGGAWVLATEDDLQRAASHPSASGMKDLNGPGGGKVVTISDPNGIPVSFIFGQTPQIEAKDEGLTHEKDVENAKSNSSYQKPRQGAFRRFEIGASPIHKLGHYGVIVPANKYKETFEFYTSTMNLKPTDSVFNTETGKDTTCFFHIDLGKEYSDHHSFFIGASPTAESAHVHHASFEINDFDTQSLGHDWLEKQGWTNCWGIGRHVLGSQIFDYWFDASGNILEHYSDGDLVNEDKEWERCSESPNSLYIWGPNIPLAFVTGKVADVGKSLIPPEPAPSVVA